MGLLESSYTAGEDGEEDERVTISIPGVDGDKDRVISESEMGDMVLAVGGALVLVLVYVPDPLGADMLLLLSGEVPSMMELPLAWVAVMSVLVVEDPVLVMAGRMLLPPTCVADRFMVVRVPVMLLVEPGRWGSWWFWWRQASSW